MYIFAQMYYVKYVHMLLTQVSGIQNQVASTYSLGLANAKEYRLQLFIAFPLHAKIDLKMRLAVEMGAGGHSKLEFVVQWS